MKVRVQFFALFRELVGRREVEIEVKAGARVADLLERVGETYPSLGRYGEMLAVAVNAEYVPLSHPLKDGDEVALIPPVSGGCLVEITEAPIDPQPWVAKVLKESNGAVVTFLGVVRRFSEGRRIDYLEYEAYAPLAEAELRRIGEEMKGKWEVEDVVFCHRVGRLEVGETSLLVVVASPHRAEAFAACQYAVDRIKERVPIWKKEVWEGGERWVGSQ